MKGTFYSCLHLSRHSGFFLISSGHCFILSASWFASKKTLAFIKLVPPRPAWDH